MPLLDFKMPMTKLLRGFRTPVPVGQPRPYLVNFWPNFDKSPGGGDQLKSIGHI